MCRDTGYYNPRDDVTVKVVEEMIEKKNYSLMVYYLKMAYQEDQHTYMNDLYWVLQNKFDDVDLEAVKEHVEELLLIDDSDRGLFEEEEDE
jgi:DNA-directed RNA polymerase subunit F